MVLFQYRHIDILVHSSSQGFYIHEAMNTFTEATLYGLDTIYIRT